MSSANTGLRARVARYFEDNQSEWLTKEDMMVKFGCTEKSLDQALWSLKADGSIERTMVFRARVAQGEAA